jgi:hypothetical protein
MAWNPGLDFLLVWGGTDIRIKSEFSWCQVRPIFCQMGLNYMHKSRCNWLVQGVRLSPIWASKRLITRLKKKKQRGLSLGQHFVCTKMEVTIQNCTGTSMWGEFVLWSNPMRSSPHCQGPDCSTSWFPESYCKWSHLDIAPWTKSKMDGNRGKGWEPGMACSPPPSHPPQGQPCSTNAQPASDMTWKVWCLFFTACLPDFKH